MGLAEISVLVDGYNLDLTKGTGIKTYGFSLVDALHHWDANVSVLTSRKVNDNKNPLLKEVLFADRLSHDNQSGLSNRIQAFKESFAALAPVSLSAVNIPRIGVVADKEQDLLGYSYLEILNSPNCYKVANARFKLLKLLTNISTPQKIDVWHATYPLPIKVEKARKITTIHDLIPLKLPYSTLDNKSFFFENIKQTIKSSDLVIAVSEATKTDILSLFHVDDPDKIVVTYQPSNLKPLQPYEAEDSDFKKRLSKYKLQKGKYFLFVGAIEPKKNVGRLIDAYLELDTDIPLVIAGKKAWLWEDELANVPPVKKSRRFMSKQVKLLEYVPSEDLRYLYSGAYCLIFPSLYEGFGLPVLEAMTLGCPVITSDVASLPEIGGDAALYVDPYSVRSIRNAMETILSDPSPREDMIAKGFKQADFLSKANYQTRLLEAYQKALSR